MVHYAAGLEWLLQRCPSPVAINTSSVMLTVTVVSKPTAGCEQALCMQRETLWGLPLLKHRSGRKQIELTSTR